MRAVGMGTPVFLLFLPLDLFVRDQLHPATPVAWCVGWRLLGTALLAVCWLFARRPGWSERGLMLLTGGVLGLSVTTLGFLAVGFGGLESAYVFTPGFYAVGIATFLPARWRRNTLLVGPATVAFFGAIVLGVALSPALAPQLTDPRALATFLQNGLLIGGIVAFAIASGHVLWRARRDALDATRLGRYLLRKRLGAGGMNEVWLAHDAKLHRDVALKILPAHGPPGPSADARRARFEREAQATSALHSPHTIRILDYGGDQAGTAWIAMEVLRGEDLDGLLTAVGPLDARRVVHLARQAAESLAEAHAKGIIHRDIKPANLFVCGPMPDGTPGEPATTTLPADFVKVLDFGIARQLDSGESQLTLAGMVVGTPAYMAPEVIRGEPADARSDVWSFGATLYTLLAGRPPYDFAHPAEHFQPHGRAPLPRLPPALAVRVPADLEALLRACLAPAAADRPADGRALADRLAALTLDPWTPAEAEAAWAERTARRAREAVAATEAEGPHAPTITA